MVSNPLLEPTITAGAGAVLGVITLKLFDIVNRLIEDRHPNASSKTLHIESMQSGLTSQQAQQLHELYVMHSKTDDDGIPLWYVPRGWYDTQIRILDILNTITSTIRTQTSILESIQHEIKRLT